MTRAELEDALRQVFSDIFDTVPECITGDTSPDTLLQWDSLGHIRLIAALEERFVSRTRFPWTQNWLNRSVQGGPEHDR